MHIAQAALLALLFAVAPQARAADPATRPSGQESALGITHSFLALGGSTYIADETGKIVWTYPHQTRDGFVLPNGNVLLAVSKGKAYPNGAAVELTRDGKTVFEFKGTQSEVNTVQALGDGRYMLTEAGPKPRIVEVDKDGKVLVEVPLKIVTKDVHMQSRMARKLANGNYLVPQLHDRVVREYAPTGEVVWEARTPDEPKECWPFTAIRLANGNTLCTLTHGTMVVEFDKDGTIVWKLTNADLPTPMLKDPCGAQRLANGNTVVACYGQGRPGAVKMLEVTPDKKVVWTYRDDRKHGVHEFHIIGAGSMK